MSVPVACHIDGKEPAEERIVFAYDGNWVVLGLVETIGRRSQRATGVSWRGERGAHVAGFAGLTAG